MRTILLREQSPQTVNLSNAELDYLTGSKLLSVGVVDPDRQFYELRAGSVVGTLVWPDLAVLIRPKVDIANLFYLLGFRPGLVGWGDRGFDYLRDLDLLLAMARFLEWEVRHGLRYGMSHGYAPREEALTTIRGRIAIARQVRVRQSQPLPLECDFVEYTEDIQLNRVIKAALKKIRVVSFLDKQVSRTLAAAESAFSEVREVDYLPGSVPSLLFSRLNQRWETAFRLAEMILNCESLRDETGRVRGLSFTVDMNKVFEKFIEELVNQEARRAGLDSAPQSSVALSAKVSMRPDLLLRRFGMPVAVGDTKYVEIEPDGWRHANLYQLLAYCTALRLPRGLLIYATPRDPETFRVAANGMDLEVIGIDLSGKVADVERLARAAARRLIEHARLIQSEAAAS